MAKTAKIKDVIQALAAYGMDTPVKLNISAWPRDLRELRDVAVSKSTGDKFVVLCATDRPRRVRR